ncbi:MAG: serine/threonine protein kinase, partial [Nostoc sp.]
DRYQSAANVSQALQSLAQPSVSTPEVSNLQTMAVGRRPQRVPPAVSPVSPKRPAPVIPPSNTNTSSILDNPLAIAAIGSAVVIIAGFGSWTLVSSIRSQP